MRPGVRGALTKTRLLQKKPLKTTNIMPKFNPSIPLPDGFYDVEIVEAVEGFTNNDNPKITVTMRVVPSGRRIFDRIVFTEQTMWVVEHFTDAIGLKVKAGENIEAADLVGRTARVSLITVEFNGKLSNKVAWQKTAPPSANTGLTPANPSV